MSALNVSDRALPRPRRVVRVERTLLEASARDRRATVAILIPVYKHSLLLAEAVASALRQDFDQPIALVIINDGCPFPETDLVATALAASHPNVYYLKKPNGGPSAARNHGLDFIQGYFEGLEAVFFLDADNRLSPSAIRNAYRVLQENSEVGWVYPHISTFEVEWYGDYDIPYSRLLHVAYDNICDTGSLVRAELIQKLRFNADARSGFEDWDFWLSAVEAGFVGKCCSGLGFEYRNRAESRFKEVSRDRGAVTAYMRDRFRKTFTARKLIAFEHIEAPRFALFEMDSLQVLTFSDPQRTPSLRPLPDFGRDFWAATTEPDKFHVPEYFLWSSLSLLQALGDARIAHNALWVVQRLLETYQFVAVRLERTTDEIDYAVRPIADGQRLADRISLIASRRDIVRSCAEDVDDGWLRSVVSDAPGPAVAELTIRAPINDGNIVYLHRSLLNSVLMTRLFLHGSAYRSAPNKLRSWRSRQFPPISEYYRLVERHLNGAPTTPLSVDPERADVGFVFPFASYGGAEKVSYALARELRKHGYRTHAFVIGGKGYRIVSEFRDAFDSINLVGLDPPALWGGSQSGRGTEFGVSSDEGIRAELLRGLLCGMDVVVNSQSAPLNAVVGDLRSLGVTSLYYIHLFDSSPLQREVGHPMLGLLFEHAYEKFLVCSHNLRRRLHGLGLPRSKLMTVENAPGFAVPDSKLLEIRQQRATAPDSTLRALFIGRMDAQKGLERVIGIVEACALRGLDVSFRFIGSSLVEDDLPAATRENLSRAKIAFEPPIFDSARLTECFAAADVMILPSRWEGAPLVTLEAQQLGCVPIATEVGALREQIHSWTDGVLVPDGDDSAVVRDFVDTLATLRSQLDERRAMALAAMDRLADVSWEGSCAEVIAWLNGKFPVREQLRKAGRARDAA